MSKNKNTPPADLEFLTDVIAELDELDLWDVIDPSDHAFWEEFFRLEETLEMADPLDAPAFTITVQNQDTGELRTYKNIRLKSARRRIDC